MDINILRSILTVAAFAAFLAIVWWAYAPSRKRLWEAKGVLEEGEDA
jgi:cbb3-type cytochrome oxidase subunit 3